jgi:hypothetical protein
MVTEHGVSSRRPFCEPKPPSGSAPDSTATVIRETRSREPGGPQALLGAPHGTGKMVVSTPEAPDDQVLSAIALGDLGQAVGQGDALAGRAGGPLQPAVDQLGDLPALGVLVAAGAPPGAHLA